MKTPLFYRIQEWAADRFSSVQYPHIRRVHDSRQPESAPRLPAWQRFYLGVLGLLGLMIALPMLIAGLFLLYCIVSVIFGL
jgi:hypothetical protein